MYYLVKTPVGHRQFYETLLRQDAGRKFESKDLFSREDLGFWVSLAWRNRPKCPVLSNLAAPYHESFRKTESNPRNNAEIPDQNIMRGCEIG